MSDGTLATSNPFDPTFWSELVASASTVGAEIAAGTVAIDELDGIFANCPAMTAADRAAWSAFKKDYNAFIDGVNANIIDQPIIWTGVGPSVTIYAGNVNTALNGIRGWQTQIVAWQKKAQSECGAGALPAPYGGLPPTPPGEDSVWWTALKWGAIGLVGATVVVAAAPAVEAFVASGAGSYAAGKAKKAAAFAGARAKKGLAATKRLVGRARGRGRGPTQNPLTSRFAIAQAANGCAQRSRYRGSAPRLTERSSRDEVTRWLQWEDPNGVHTDELARADRIDPYTEGEAWAALADVVGDC